MCEAGDAAPVGARRHDAIGDEEPREARRGRKAEIKPDFRNRFRASGQSLDRAPARSCTELSASSVHAQPPHHRDSRCRVGVDWALSRQAGFFIPEHTSDQNTTRREGDTKHERGPLQRSNGLGACQLWIFVNA